MFFSPLSIYSALSLVFAGSAGKSREEFLTVFHLTDQGDLIKMLGDGLKSIFEQDAKKTMVQAIGAFIDGSLSLLQQYTQTLKQHFEAEFQDVNFAAASEAARIINSWISKSTHGKIGDMIDPSSLSDETRMILANAVYFKGESIEQRFD